MKIYRNKAKTWSLFNDDCVARMAKLPENSFDAIICDPPYNLTSITKRFGNRNSAKAKHAKDGSFQRLSGGFMNRIWDGTGIAFKKKPGKPRIEC